MMKNSLKYLLVFFLLIGCNQQKRKEIEKQDLEIKTTKTISALQKKCVIT